MHVGAFIRHDLEVSAESLSVGYLGSSTSRDKPVVTLMFLSPYGALLEFDSTEISVPKYFVVERRSPSVDRQVVDLYLSEIAPGRGVYNDEAVFEVVVGGSRVEKRVPIVGYIMEELKPRPETENAVSDL